MTISTFPERNGANYLQNVEICSGLLWDGNMPKHDSCDWLLLASHASPRLAAWIPQPVNRSWMKNTKRRVCLVCLLTMRCCPYPTHMDVPLWSPASVAGGVFQSNNQAIYTPISSLPFPTAPKPQVFLLHKLHSAWNSA